MEPGYGLKSSSEEKDSDDYRGDEHNHHCLFHADKHHCRHNRRPFQFFQTGLAFIVDCTLSLVHVFAGKSK